MLWLISQLSEDASRRKIFVNSAVEMLKNYSFDGLDINWMHPTGEGGQPEDKVGCDLGTPRTTAAPWTVLGVLLVIAVWMIRFIYPSWLFYFVSSICERQLPFIQIPICLQTVNSEIPEALHDPESSFERQNKVNDRHTSKFESSKRNSRQKFHFKQIRDWHHKSPEDKTSEVDNHKARIINTKWLFFRISQGFMFERSKEKKKEKLFFLRCFILF